MAKIIADNKKCCCHIQYEYVEKRMNLLTKTVIKEQFFAGRAERLSQINLRLKYFTMFLMVRQFVEEIFSFLHGKRQKRQRHFVMDL